MARIIVTVVAVTAVLSGTAVAQTPQHHRCRSRRPHDHGAPAGRLGSVHFATSCAPAVQPTSSTAASRCCTRSGSPRRSTSFNGVLKDDPSCVMAHWGIAMSWWSNPFGGFRSPQALAAGLAAVDAARATRRAAPNAKRPTSQAVDAALSRRRHARSADAHRRLREGDGGAGRQVPRRRRGAHLLRAGPGPDGAAHRQDLRQPVEGGGDPGRGVLAPARAPRPGALHHPQLRRAAAGVARR